MNLKSYRKSLQKLGCPPPLLSSRLWLSLVGIVLLLALGSAFKGTPDSSLASTQRRLGHGENPTPQAERRHGEAVHKNNESGQSLRAAERWLQKAVIGLEARQIALDSRVDSRIWEELFEIRSDSQQQLRDITLKIDEGYRVLAVATQLDMASLREAVSAWIHKDHQGLKVREMALLSLLTEQVIAAQREADAFKE